MRLGATELIVILIIALVVFGGGKIAGVGKALGRSIHDFKEEVNKSEDETAEKTDDEKKDQ